MTLTLVDGVAVRRVAPGSPAWRFGLRDDDVMLAVNRERVRNLDALRRLARGRVNGSWFSIFCAASAAYCSLARMT